jgi:hypothetical protein
MPIELPGAIADYFVADAGLDAGAVAACFTQVAIVKDEGHTYVGRDAIRRWKDESSAKYTYTVEPFSVAREGDRQVVTSHLVGDFPGSPTNLRYFFALDGDKIAELEIIP